MNSDSIFIKLEVDAMKVAIHQHLSNVQLGLKERVENAVEAFKNQLPKELDSLVEKTVQELFKTMVVRQVENQMRWMLQDPKVSKKLQQATLKATIREARKQLLKLEDGE